MRRSSSVLFLLLSPALAGAFPLPAGREFQVNAYFTAEQQRPDVARASNGDFVVVWESQIQDGSSLGIFARRYDADGTPVTAEFEVNTSTAGTQYHPAVASDPAGNFVVVWDHVLSGIIGRRYDAAGVPLGGEFTVGSTGPFGHPDVVRDAAGNFVVVWKPAFTTILARRYDAAGTPQGPAFQVNTTSVHSYSPAVAADAAGNFVVVWMTNAAGGDGILGQRYDSTGAPQGGEFQVSAAVGGNFNFVAAVGRDSGGSFLVAWNVFCCAPQTGILARLYDGSGTPVGPEFKVDTEIGPNGVTPAVGAVGAGEFVVLWAGDLPGAEAEGIFGRRYDGTGAPAGPGFEVHSSGPTSRFYPSISSDAGGEFVVAWQSDKHDGDREGVFARRFSREAPANGTRVVLRDDVDPAKRRLTLQSNDRTISTAPGAGLDPVASGAFLHVYNDDGSGESVCIGLPAGGWSAAGNPARPVLTYRDPDLLSGPCSRVTLVSGRSLRARCRDVGFSLDEPQQGSIGISLVSGDARYCGVFGGTITRDSGAEGLFKARNAPPPVACPTPPAACP